MKKIILLNVFLFAFLIASFSQNNEFINDEVLEQFSGIEKSKSSLNIIPQINWPIASTQKDEVFEYQFKLNKNTNIDLSKIPLEGNSKAFIITKNDVSYLSLSTPFPPQSQKMLVRIFYQLGIEQIYLNNNLVSVYRYATEYKSVAHQELLKTRVYLKN